MSLAKKYFYFTTHVIFHTLVNDTNLDGIFRKIYTAGISPPSHIHVQALNLRRN